MEPERIEGRPSPLMRLIDALTYPLLACEEFSTFWGMLDFGEDAACGIAQSARPFVVAARFAQCPQPTLVVVAGEEAADDFARNLASYLGQDSVVRFPDRKDFPWDDHAADPSVIAARMRALHVLQTERDCLVVASGRSLLRKLMPPSACPHAPIVVECDHEARLEGEDSMTFEDFVRALERYGYENTHELEGPGSFAVGGGTVDVHPGTSAYPIRIDFFGDDIEDVRRIVASTGQTISHIDRFEIYSAREVIPTKRASTRAREALAKPAQSNPVLRELLEEVRSGVVGAHTDALLSYYYEQPALVGDFLPSSAMTVLVEPRSVFDDALHAFDDVSSRAAGTSIPAEGSFAKPSKLDFGTCQRATYQSIMRVGGQVDVEMPVKRTEVAGSEEKLFGRLRSFAESGYTTVFSVPNLRAREDMKLDLVDRGIPIIEVIDENGGISAKLKPGFVHVTDVDVPLGIVLPKPKIALVSLSDTQGSSSLRAGKRVDITEVTFPFSPGDYVVHAAHGVAFFRDLVRQDVGGVERDYLLLEYAEDDKLYVPVEQLDRVTRYVGPEGSSPRLTRLNTSDWSRALMRARKASKKLAFDLVDVYARRSAAQGHAFSPDTPWQHQMEEDFPYAETPDQMAAIADVKADMQSGKPMDRLICGDVGFGKTEVALRAAFKATQDNKQVMVLCPTTILAQQHFTTFSERFEPYGVSVEVLSRFRTAPQQKQALEGFSDGSVSVLVGTHRLLSRDVNPKDLGLVIIDEEQRFGVGHKEQLKNLRESIDVLTLSATPIPRTMQMSLSGVRDMSLILTPPDDRRPVEVHVGEWDPDVVSGAILRELERKGQVYYVSNRVRSMDDAVSRVSAAAPSARIGVAHGKMGKDDLERVMEEFSAGTIDVLVATTIIESGIDNPHTNTLIIEDAQRLGLAQMYQLKGRVGRSSAQAYAYFMFPEHANMTEEAVARLTAINEHQDLGSGMRVAMRDLEIRGAGTLLGAEQSGNMSAVGFDLFAQMIATAVNEAREGVREVDENLPRAMSDIVVNVAEHAYIPEEYIRDADARVLLYRKVAGAADVDSVERLRRETSERYGAMPQATENYFEKACVRTLAAEMGCDSVTVAAGKLNLEPVASPQGELWADLRRARARYVPSTRKLQVPLKFFEGDGCASLLGSILAFMRELAGKEGAAGR